eukprot:2954752-Karenia_brevis.AAC.1
MQEQLRDCSIQARNVLRQTDGLLASDMLRATGARIVATNNTVLFRALAPLHAVVRTHSREGRW